MTGQEFVGNCIVCAEAKQTNAPGTGRLVEESEDITLYIDTCVPIQTQSQEQNRYFMTMTTKPH